MDALRNTEYLCCLVDATGIGIAVENVQEVFETRFLTRLPDCPAVLAGMVNVRGSVIPVMDPWKVDPRAGSVRKIVILKTGDGPVGLLITRLLDLMHFETFEAFGIMPPPLNRFEPAFDAVARDNEGASYFLLNTVQLLQAALPRAAGKD